MRSTITLISACLLVVACQKFYPPDNNQQISKHNEDESHNNGQNCMNCHYQAGNGEGWFSVGGTAYGNYQSGYVDLYTDQSLRTLVMSLEIDQLGNFYTTEAIDVTSEGLVVGVRDAQGNVELMNDPIEHGQCNLCHGTVIEP